MALRRWDNYRLSSLKLCRVLEVDHSKQLPAFQMGEESGDYVMPAMQVDGCQALPVASFNTSLIC